MKPEPAADLRAKLIELIIEWLGAAYDAENCMLGNPDYRNLHEVEELADTICKEINP